MAKKYTIHGTQIQRLSIKRSKLRAANITVKNITAKVTRLKKSLPRLSSLGAGVYVVMIPSKLSAKQNHTVLTV